MVKEFEASGGGQLSGRQRQAVKGGRRTRQKEERGGQGSKEANAGHGGKRTRDIDVVHRARRDFIYARDRARTAPRPRTSDPRAARPIQVEILSFDSDLSQF
jgi:hypothetical protein